MKKIIAILCLSLSFNGLNAQFQHHDIQLSYGLLTANQFMDIAESVLISVLSFGNYEKENHDYSGARFISYKNSVTYRLGVGACLGVDNVKGDLVRRDVQYGEFRESHTTLALEGDIKWVKRDFIQMYTGAGLGISLNKERGEIIDTGETDSVLSNHVAFQLNAVGLRLGKSFGGFLELGFGYKGMLNFGLSYQFE